MDAAEADRRRSAELEREIEREIAAWRADPRARLHRGLLVASTLAAIAAVIGSRFEWVDAYARGEIDLAGEPRFEPLHPVDPEALARVDLEELHARAIPEWIERLGEAQTAGGRRRAEEAWRLLRVALEPEPNLLAIWDELHELLTQRPAQSARRIDWLLWAHDQYLDRAGAPYRIEASLHLRGRRPIVSTLSYRVLADLDTTRGRVRVLKRIDRTRIVEGWLGHTARAEDGAIVIADRVLHFAVRHAWPALNEALDGRRPSAERGVLEGVREEAEAALDPEHLALLRATAEDEQVLIEVADSIRARRACGARFDVFELPYRGISVASHQALRQALWASRYSQCPDVTLSEASALVGASERLRTAEGLEAALESLTAWVARGIAAHELRHVEDVEAPLCSGCFEGMPPVARSELSAYLAALATPGIGYLAALQACAAPGEAHDARHALAIQMAMEAAIPGGCSGDAGVGLYARARTAERRYFGARTSAELPAAFPTTLAVLSRRAPAVSDAR